MRLLFYVFIFYLCIYLFVIYLFIYLLIYSEDCVPLIPAFFSPQLKTIHTLSVYNTMFHTNIFHCPPVFVNSVASRRQPQRVHTRLIWFPHDPDWPTLTGCNVIFKYPVVDTRFFVFYVTTSFNDSDYVASNEEVIPEWWTGNEVEGNGRDLILRYYRSTCLEGQRKTTKTITRDIDSRILETSYTSTQQIT
jgi:hypothetical protein